MRQWSVAVNEQQAKSTQHDSLQDAVSHALTLLSAKRAEVVLTAPNGRDVYVIRKLLT